MKFSIITPLFNRVDLTANFIQNIFQYLKDGELILVDNASSDNTFGMVQFFKSVADVGERINYIRNESNLGFSKANNIGAEQAKSDVLLFISNDVVAHGDFITKVLETLNDNNLIGARMVNFNSGWNKFKELDNPIHYLEGWFIACRKSVFEKLLGWDGRYFLDYEDLDLSYKAIQKGVELVELQLPLQHMVGQSAVLLPSRLALTLESQKEFCNKWNLTI